VILEIFSLNKVFTVFLVVLLSASLVGLCSLASAQADVLLEDGFELRSFSAWSGNAISLGETASVVSGTRYPGVYGKFFGDYSGYFMSNGQSGYEKAYVYENLSPALSEIYAQAYFIFDENGIVDNGDRIKFIEFRSGANIVAAAGLRMQNNALYWWMETRNGASWVETFSQKVNSDLSRYFNVELKWKNNGMTGGGSLWVNGALIYQIFDLDTNNFGDCSQVRIGLVEAYNCGVTRLYVDNAAISTMQTSQKYTLTVETIVDYTGVAGGGLTSPSGTHVFEAGSTVTASVVALFSGNIFSHWLLDGINVGSANSYTATMNKNIVLTAVFSRIPVAYEDGFESGTSTLWRSRHGSATRITEPVYAGAYSACFNTSGLGGYEKAYVDYNTKSAREIYTQAYFRIGQNGMLENGDRIKLIEFTTGTSNTRAILAAAGLRMQNNALYWWMETRNGANWVETYTSKITIDTDQWFNLELGWKEDSTAGGGSLWVNGALIFQINNADTDNFGDCLYSRVGLVEVYNCAPTTLYVDNFICSENHIGV